MKRNGFTLAELLAVLVILALIMTIAVPSALKIAANVRSKSYDTKITLIEETAKRYGQNNLANVRYGKDVNTNTYGVCDFTITNDAISNMTYQTTYSQTSSNNLCIGKNDCHMCIRKTIADLVNMNELDWDYENNCDTTSECVSEEDQENYQNIVINPIDRSIINKCYVYIYYKNSRVYTYFDKINCVVKSSFNNNGLAYENKY